jgi:exodeoxyribonuclease VII large subunit
LSLSSSSAKIYTVRELTDEISSLLEEHFEFVWVEGEISNFSSPLSGHYYMVLKDEKAQIRAVMFRHQARFLRFVPEDGMKVIAQGRIGVYAPRGEYQVLLDYLEPMGVGALTLAFEQTKKKLAAEGVFDEAVKKPLPFLPQRIAVITSPTGAAIRDFLKILHRRYTNMEVVVVPTRVQGEGAAEEIIHALETVNRKWPVDVIVLTRGGGSLEDLWAFNSEALALAIRDSHIPVVSAVGHEIDVTIADLAADVRAPTPSAAAEMLVVEKETLVHRVGQLSDRLESRMQWIMERSREDLEEIVRRLRDPRKRLAESWLRVDDLWGRLMRLGEFSIREGNKRLESEKRALLHHSPFRRIRSLRQETEFHARALKQAVNGSVSGKRMAFTALGERLRGLDPLSILRRGYSVTLTLPEKQVVRRASAVAEGDRVQVLLGEGKLACKVEEINEESGIPFDRDGVSL